MFLRGRAALVRRAGPCSAIMPVLSVLLMSCPSAFALNPSLDISQYAHTAWTVRSGFLKAGIHAIAQTPDGYLWLGTEFGLLRFDGVQTTPWESLSHQQFPATQVWTLATTRDGTLWIGTDKGLASWKSGKLSLHSEFAGQTVATLLLDHNGTLWVGTVSTGTGKV